MIWRWGLPSRGEEVSGPCLNLGSPPTETEFFRGDFLGLCEHASDGESLCPHFTRSEKLQIDIMRNMQREKEGCKAYM